MLYALLRAIAGIALRWYYGHIDVEGLERVPRRGPVLLAVNHPNALVDALVVGWAVGRRVTLTAKATLFRNPLLAWFLGVVGVVPLVRASDMRDVSRDVSDDGGAPDPRRNARAFDRLHAVLRRGGAVLIFPEGKSHDEPRLAPLRTGAARIALGARADAGVAGLALVPIGLVFERKEAPRSRILARVGAPLAVDDWPGASDDPATARALTDELEARLRGLTLDFATRDDAARATALASTLAALLGEPRAVDQRRPLAMEVAIAERVREAAALLASADDALRARVDDLLRRLADFQRALATHGVSVDDVAISTRLGPGARFAAREGLTLAVAGPIALWGEINHWLPFHAARAIARRSIESRADPAMRAIVAGTGLVLAFYAAQAALVTALAGWLPGAIYLVSLPLAADVNFLLRERLARARRRARAYLLFRRRPKLHTRWCEELEWLRGEAVDVERDLQFRGGAAVVGS